MSVLIPSKDVFNYVGVSMDRCIYGSEVNEWFHDSMRNHFNKCGDIDKEQVRLVESWMRLNDLSYCCKYGEAPNKSYKWRRNFTHKEVTVYQLLKYIQCIRYNIELCTIQEKMEVTDQMRADENLLRIWADDIAHAIVGQIKEYDAADWSH